MLVPGTIGGCGTVHEFTSSVWPSPTGLGSTFRKAKLLIFVCAEVVGISVSSDDRVITRINPMANKVFCLRKL